MGGRPRPVGQRVDRSGRRQRNAGFVEEIHEHTGAGDFSGIYLLELNETNKTHFYCSGGNTAMKLLANTRNIPEGSIILFPSHLLHYVTPCEAERATVSCNISLAYP